MKTALLTLCAALALVVLGARAAQAQQQPTLRLDRGNLQLAPGMGAPGAPAAVAQDPDAPRAPEQPAPTGTGSAIAFWVFAFFAVGGAIVTITRKNAISAVMALVATFFAIAAIYAMLFAHFMAAIQVLVYAGAIMVLFVFVVMILNKEEEEPWALRHGWLGKALAAGTLMYLTVRLVQVLWTVKDTAAEKAWKAGEFAAYGTTKAVGKELFTTYLFPFEAISIALLIAIVGAVVLAHPDHPSEQAGGSGPSPEPNAGPEAR